MEEPYVHISLSERSQPEKATHGTISTPRLSEKGKTMETVKGSVLAGVSREGGWIGGAQRTFRVVKSFCVTL